MKSVLWILVGLLSVSAPVLAGSEKAFYFDQDKAGSHPAGLTSDGDSWRVVANSYAVSAPNVLVGPQTALAGGKAVILLATGSQFLNGDIGLRFRMQVDGAPSMVGLVWRYQDPDNFYALQVDTAGENFILLKRAKGKTKVIKRESTIITAPVWHAIQVQMIDRRIVVTYDGDTLIDVMDKAIKGPGQVGLQGAPGDAIQIDNFAYRTH